MHLFAHLTDEIGQILRRKPGFEDFLMPFLDLVLIDIGHAEMRIAGFPGVAIPAFEQALRINILLGDHVVDVADLLDQRLGVDMMLLVIGDLLGAPPFGLRNRLVHGIRDFIGVHDDRSRHISRGAADGLNQRTIGPQESFLVGIQYRHQRNLWQIKPLAQQVDADYYVNLAFTQLAQELDAPQRVDIGMQIFDFDAFVEQVIGQVLCHLLGECRDQRTLVLGYAILDFGEQVVDLPFDRSDLNLRIQQAGGTDDLFDHAVGEPELVITRGRRQIDGLSDSLKEFVPFERTVVHR